MQTALFFGKSRLLQLRRFYQDKAGNSLVRHPKSTELCELPIVAESTTRLWNTDSFAEKRLTSGKVQNLRLAARALSGVEVPAGVEFSFWKHVGRANRRRGFVEGREIREGCVIPTVGGGLCQMSNALYDCALKAGFEITERHAHSRVVEGSMAEAGRDATVFWNYVDLRFRSTNKFRIETELDRDNLIVRIRADRDSALKSKKTLPVFGEDSRNGANSCETCGVESCFRVLHEVESQDFTTIVVDEYYSEFDQFIKQNFGSGDRFLQPIDGARFKKANYAWSSKGFSSVSYQTLLTIERAVRSRKLAAQGAARQRNLLEMSERLADSYFKSIDPMSRKIVVQQNLLPHLYRNGALGGREYIVLMNALPMAKIQEKLDFAKSLHPESTTLGDFRADDKLVELETMALENATEIVTPHREIAELFGAKARLIDWKMPETAKIDRKQNAKPVVVFPASTVGRKGVYELRDALRGRDVELILMGPLIESGSFWDGFSFTRDISGWVSRADLVVLPAFVEHRPRRLLTAIANGIPVICSPECGIPDSEAVTIAKSGDSKALGEAIENVLGGF